MRDYPIIEKSFSALSDAVSASGIPHNACMLVGDSNTMPIYGKCVEAELLKQFQKVNTYTFPAGEQYKTLASVEGLIREMQKCSIRRNDCVFALGGGVTGDMAGFAAAIFLRGIRVVQLPTSLLAMIDSSIGGKTAVDLDAYKNMIGAFHMPEFVYAATDTLKTLPKREFISGMGEMIKTALLGDRELFDLLYSEHTAVSDPESGILTDLIARCAAIKTDIVRRDPREAGERALLNLGHTIGHAIEKYKDFTMLHGECVAAGLSAASYISMRRGLISENDHNRINETLVMYGLPTKVGSLNADEILKLTRSDKKMSGTGIRFVLIQHIGKAFYTDDLREEELLAGIRSIMN